ncbi:hypothetical protein [Salinisphaera sp. T31B1]|uniref:hypothetical protein n=1 Tax=Salinisphaera sp. T31B1 TaxID=727963 RepID=UPI00333F82CF
MKKLLWLYLLILMMPFTTAWAASGLDARLLALQHGWAHANYEVDSDKARAEAFAALEPEAQALVDDYPGRAEPLIWQGIVRSGHAGAKGGLGALSLVKKAREDFDTAIRIDPRALQGSAYTSLGVLYYKVPGWPLAFGDDDKAQSNLEHALAINPDGIDPNYFYAEFLAERKKDYAQALLFLDKADAAKPRPARPLADAGRRREIAALRSRVEQHVGE